MAKKGFSSEENNGWKDSELDPAAATHKKISPKATSYVIGIAPPQIFKESEPTSIPETRQAATDLADLVIAGLR